MTFSTLGTDTQTNQPVYLYKASRTQGLYIVGLQGMGKSGLLENLIIDDIKQGTGVCVLDPHGELIDHVIARLPGKAEEEKVICLDLAEEDYFFGLNLFECADPTNNRKVSFTRSQVLHVFEKAYEVSQPATPRIYDYLFNSAYTLITNPGYTLLEIPLVFNDACRQKLLANVSSDAVHKFWGDYKHLPQQKQDEEARELLRRLNDLSDDPLRYIVGQSQSTINLQKIMDEGKILLVKLSRRLEQATSLIGSIIVALILNASAARTTHKQFHLYADEFQRFATEDFATLLEEARKAVIGITMAHQNRAQLELSDKQADKQLKARTLNVGSLVVFRVPTDAVALAGQFDTTPPPAELRQQEILIPSADVGDRLLKTGHLSNNVLDFFGKWISSFDGLFRQLADGANPRSLVVPVSLFKQMVEVTMPYKGKSPSFTLPFFDAEMYYHWMFEEEKIEYHSTRGLWRASSHERDLWLSMIGKVLVKPRKPPEQGDKYDETHYWYKLAEWHTPRDFCWLMLRDGVYNEDPLTPEAIAAYNNLWTAPDEPALLQAFATYETLVRQNIHDNIVRDVHRFLNQNRGHYFIFYAKDIRALQEAQYCTPQFNSRYYNFLVGLGIVFLPVGMFHFTQVNLHEEYCIDINQSVSWTHPYIAKEVDHIVSEQKNSFEAFVRQCREVLDAYALAPVALVRSGIYEMKPVGQLSSDEMRNRTEKELVHLPQYTARVKLTDTSETIVEHMLATREPEKGLYGRLLEDRVERIKLHTRSAGYTRPRKEVEVEISQRQTRCSNGSSFVQPQKSKQPPQPQGRLMPICSSCGSQNQPGAKFCNQCGSQLEPTM